MSVPVCRFGKRARVCFASVRDVLSEVVIVLYDVALSVSWSKNRNECFRCLEDNSAGWEAVKRPITPFSL